MNEAELVIRRVVDEVREEILGHVLLILIGNCKDFGSYSEMVSHWREGFWLENEID